MCHLVKISDLDAVREGEEKELEAYMSYGDNYFLNSDKEMRQMWNFHFFNNIFIAFVTKGKMSL